MKLSQTCVLGVFVVASSTVDITAPCTATPGSSSPVGSTVQFNAGSGGGATSAQLEFLEDGVLKLNGATCLEADLCNKCTSDSANLQEKIDALNQKVADLESSALTGNLDSQQRKWCTRLTALAGACRASHSSGSTFIAFQDLSKHPGETGTEVCNRALCGNILGGAPTQDGSGKWSYHDGTPFPAGYSSTNGPQQKDGKWYANDQDACHFDPICKTGWSYNGKYSYGNECANGVAAGGVSGVICCQQASNAGPGPFAGLHTDTGEHAGISTGVEGKCPWFENDCVGHSCVYS